MKGLRASIYNNAEYGNCSNGGISAKCKQVTIVGPGIPEIFEANEEAPAVEIERRMIGRDEVVSARPYGKPSDTKEYAGPMFGGCFIYTSDSRFRELVSPQPVALHDRFESWEMYDFMSK